MLGGRGEYAISGGAPLGERLGHFFRGIGFTVLEGYGLTESCAATAFNPWDRPKIGTVGQPLPGSVVRIADDGEVLLHGEHLFQGYWNNEAATAEALADGWFHTGDIGTLDEDGYLAITGRKKEIIVTAGGKNVAPAVIEDRIRAHALVAECMVVGDGRPFVGALITLDEEFLGRWAEEHGKPVGATVAPCATTRSSSRRCSGPWTTGNAAVSKAESVRKFRMLGAQFTEEAGHITPSLKLKRNVVAKDFADGDRGDLHPLTRQRRRRGLVWSAGRHEVPQGHGLPGGRHARCPGARGTARPPRRPAAGARGAAPDSRA